MNFEYRSLSNQVYFGQGKLSVLIDLLKEYERVMLISGKSMQPHTDRLISLSGVKKMIHFSEIKQHVPVALIREAHEFLIHHNPEILLAMGGGSTIGLAKALALETGLPIIAVPSTYSGSEQTNIWGKTTELGKTTGRSDLVLPRVVIYDTDLTITMPRLLAVTSAMNAMAHLIESVYAPSGNPVTSHLAILGMMEIKKGLELIANLPALTPHINEKILFGAYLAGKCLAEVPMSLHHKAAHVLGGRFDLDHSSVHTVLLPYVLDYQWPYLNETIRTEFTRILGDHPVKALKNLASNAGAKTDLKSIGFQSDHLEAAADLIVSTSFSNPAPVTKEGIFTLLENAFQGRLKPEMD